MDDDHRRRQLELDGHCAKQHLYNENDQRQGSGISQGGIVPVLQPGDRRDGSHNYTHERRRPTMPDLDHGGKVERRKPLAVAARPVVPTSHARAGDSYDATEHDEPKRQSDPEPREASQESKLVGRRCFHWSRS